MKNKIINFLFKKRIKLLKSKKGFSIIEVLIAVAIIGIISAIAVPEFNANRREAAKVAGDTSMTNILKAYRNCTALKTFTQCNSLESMGIDCPDCKQDAGTTGKFCAYIEKETGGETFKACVSVDTTASPSTIKRTYGGTLFNKLCKKQKTSSTDTPNPTCAGDPSASAMAPVKVCGADSDCGENVDATTSACGATYTCVTASDSGECSSGVCG